MKTSLVLTINEYISQDCVEISSLSCEEVEKATKFLLKNSPKKYFSQNEFEIVYFRRNNYGKFWISDDRSSQYNIFINTLYKLD